MTTILKHSLAVSLFALPVFAASVPTAKPEEVGLSSERLQRINQMIQRRIASGDLTGAVTIVARRGKVAHLNVQGVMDLDSKQPMTNASMFRIASMTKPVVGVAVMMLVEEGKLRINDPVSRYIPEFRGMRVAVAEAGGRGAAGPGATKGGQTKGGAPATPQFYTVPADREITIKDLLTHVSGLGSGPMGDSVIAKVARKEGDKLADYIPRLGTTVLEFQPGSRWTYSPGAGFETLGRLIEIASGMPLDQFLRQRIFDPLGMKDTFFYPADGNPRIATLYEQANGTLRKVANPVFMNGAYLSGGGGLFSTAEDYLQFALMLMNRGQLDNKRLLGARTVDLMASVFTPDTLPGRQAGEGFGLSVRVVSDPAARNTFTSKGTFGWSGAFNTHFFIDPVEHIVGIFMTQSAYLPSRGELREDFETAVMQSIVGGGAGGTN